VGCNGGGVVTRSKAILIGRSVDWHIDPSDGLEHLRPACYNDLAPWNIGPIELLQITDSSDSVNNKPNLERSGSYLYPQHHSSAFERI
jgi:hypothetical protein